jgi:hypothetical protein
VIRAARALVVATAVTLVVGLGGPPAGAATLADHGWWWRGQSGLLMELPPPPTIPEGGLSVAVSPDGDVAWSAVRFQMDESESAPVLVFTVANDLGGQVAAIDACRANVRWRGGAAQRWDTRPQPQCDAGAVAGVRSEDGATWTWDLSTLVGDDGTVDVLLVPGADAQPFQQDFDAPTDASLETSLTPTGPDPVAPPPVVPPATDSAPPPPATPDAAPAPLPPPPVAVAPPTAASPPAPPPAVAPPAPGTGTDADAPAPVAAVDPAAMPAQDLGRPVGLFLLIAAMLTVLQLRGAPVPAIHGIGRFAVGAVAEDEIRGLGRFARPRTGRPKSLI